jgi:ketosteroid isomerase-like protein
LHCIESAAGKVGTERTFTQTAMAILARGQIAIPVHLTRRGIANETDGSRELNLRLALGFARCHGTLGKGKHEKGKEQFFHNEPPFPLH